MDDKNYYNYMNDKQRDAVTDLWMTGINKDGKVLVQWKDVEKAISIIVKEGLKRK